MVTKRTPSRPAAPVKVTAPHPAAWLTARGLAAQYAAGAVRLEQLPDGSVRVVNVSGA